MEVIALADVLGDGAARCAPAASVALLLDHNVRRAEASASADTSEPIASRPRTLKRALYRERRIVTVVKIGGGLLAHDGCLDTVLDVIADVARDEPLLIVPGGGPFADAVRDQDARLRLTDAAAHWMAVLAMDQYAHLIVARMRGAVLVSSAAEISVALDAGQVPVLAPYAWLRRDDALPHSWQVTSDSIAAWIAREVGASRLTLIKPPGSGSGPDSVDGYFAQVRGPLAIDVIPADAVDRLRPATRI
jgi:aspartokinase-like uncharacterized kinase